jgi:hypothetical protein
MNCRSLLATALASLPWSALAVAQAPDFDPIDAETVLDTDSTVVTPTTGAPFTVTGGVFVFRNVTIGAGKVVRGVGSKPMIWVCETMQIDGRLTVRGGDGQRVLTLGSANFPSNGGRGGAAGGDGGSGSPQIAIQSLAGQPGNGLSNVRALGGGGGQLSFDPTCQRGSGGGGGAFATNGDPWFKVKALPGYAFVQQLGVGGFGCTGASGAVTRVLPGGGPGGSLFVDARDDNNFFGAGFDFASGQAVLGELPFLTGGAGGGGGGDLSNDSLLLSPNWIQDARGGGGGGGGGCLVILANVIEVRGHVDADGGHGGGGETAGSSNKGGGGGGGSGGLVFLLASDHMDLHVKGETYANGNYEFVASADGGVCKTDGFLAPIVNGKYSWGFTTTGANYDLAPLGGLGGMGIVQLAAPAGANLDNTNTRLDDSIHLISNGVPLSGASKQRFLAWRGYRNAQGVRVDDNGVPVVIGDNEGDIRPSPVLMRL